MSGVVLNANDDWEVLGAALITPNAIGQRGRDAALAALSRRREEEKRLRLALSASNLGTGVLVERLASLRKQLQELRTEAWNVVAWAEHYPDTGVALVNAIRGLRAILNPEQETP